MSYLSPLTDKSSTELFPAVQNTFPSLSLHKAAAPDYSKVRFIFLMRQFPLLKLCEMQFEVADHSRPSLILAAIVCAFTEQVTDDHTSFDLWSGRILPQKSNAMPRTNAGWWDIHWQAAGAGRGWGIIWRRARLGLLPPAPQVCPGKGLAPTPCPFAFSLPSLKQNQCLKRKETNQHIKYEFLKKCLSLWIAHSLLSQPPLCLRPLARPVLVPCQRNSGSVCPLWLSQSSGESVGLANTDSCWDLHRAAAAFGQSSPHCPPMPQHPDTPVLPLFHSCLALTHVWLQESNWHFIQHWTMLLPLLSKPSCFSANLALQMHFNNGTYSD